MTREPAEATRVSRRTYLAGGVTAVTAAVAGCTEGAVTWLADKVYEEVNVLAEDGIEASGTVTVVDPEGETQLSTGFSVSDNGDSATYDDVWTTTGAYEVDVQLDEPLANTQEKSGAVTISDANNDRLFVLLGADGTDEEINFRAGDEDIDVILD